MRTLNPQISQERKRKILLAAVHHYIRTARPVASSLIEERFGFGWSSATIRNVLMELEAEGYLNHPHPSAGRIPTDKGYRFFVDSLAEMQRLAVEEEARIRQEYERRLKEIEELMVGTSRMLSAVSHYAGFVMAPRLDRSFFQHLELIPLDRQRFFVILVAQSGLVKHRIVETKEPIPAERLARITRLLNESLRGLTLQQVRDEILDRIEAAAQEYQEVTALARDLSRETFDLRNEEEGFYVDGAENILSLPDFQDTDRLRALLRLIEEKQILAEALQQHWQAHGVRVNIGSENHAPELEEVSVVSSTYLVGGRDVGILGIIGPKRMEYPRMIAVVDTVTRIVNEILKQWGGAP
ncbi:MAG: heat-inducible transcription repressor HrcA [Elusimicrobia bacterium]|nr:heat-inducible transcription repressor HrcA [Elusimicrobiota bacterium]